MEGVGRGDGAGDTEALSVANRLQRSLNDGPDWRAALAVEPTGQLDVRLRTKGGMTKPEPPKLHRHSRVD